MSIAFSFAPLLLIAAAALGQDARPADTETVVLLHGLGRTKSSMSALAQALESRGFKVVNYGYPSRKKDLTALAEDLFRETVAPRLARGERLDFVTHSMGGIVLRRMLKLHPEARVGRIVMIAPPNNGAATARMVLDLPVVDSVLGPAAQELKSPEHLEEVCAVPETEVMVIAGSRGDDPKNPTILITGGMLEEPNDGTVTVEETKLPRMTAFVQVPDSHTLIASNPVVIDEVKRFLRNEQRPSLRDTLDAALERLAKEPGLLEDRKFRPPHFNAAVPTLGGHVFWTDLAIVQGWRVQRNAVFGNCRILDPAGRRKAWGSETAILEYCRRLAQSQ